MPELTKPTIVTVVADEDWIIAVTPAPSNTPLNLLPVSFSSIADSLPPPSFSRLCPICCIHMKSARPPSMVSTENISNSTAPYMPIVGQLCPLMS